jgi:hypothetical protein
MRWLLLLLSLSGCAAGRSAYFLINAERTYKSALDARAAERAVYEFTLAGAYLDKAKEEAGYSRYSASEKLAKASMEHAAKAQELAEEQGVNMEDADKFVPEEKKKEEEKERTDTLDNIDLDEI